MTSTCSDSNGYYFVEKADAATGLRKLVAIGGRTNTGTELPDFGRRRTCHGNGLCVHNADFNGHSLRYETENTVSCSRYYRSDAEQLLTKDVWSEAQSADSATAAVMSGSKGEPSGSRNPATARSWLMQASDTKPRESWEWLMHLLLG